MVSPPTLRSSEVIVTPGKCVRQDRWEFAVFRKGWRICCLVDTWLMRWCRQPVGCRKGRCVGELCCSGKRINEDVRGKVGIRNSSVTKRMNWIPHQWDSQISNCCLLGCIYWIYIHICTVRRSEVKISPQWLLTVMLTLFVSSWTAFKDPKEQIIMFIWHKHLL